MTPKIDMTSGKLDFILIEKVEETFDILCTIQDIRIFKVKKIL